MTVSERVQSASYEVADIIALKSECNEPAESVILPACQKWSKLRSVIKPNKKLAKFLFRPVLFRERLYYWPFRQHWAKCNGQACQFALQIYESDISNHAQLIAFSRFIEESVIVNQFLCCKNSPSNTKGQDVFEIHTTYLKKHGLS